MYRIELHEAVAEFMQGLNERAKVDKLSRGLLKKIMYCIARLEQDGTRVGEPITKHIDGKLWELRPDDHRILFFGHDGNHFLLLHVFRKETKRTPSREIEIAERRMKEITEGKG